MRTIFLLLFGFMTFLSFSQLNQEVEDQKHEQLILIGQVNKEGFLKNNYKSWFVTEYDGYEVDTFILKELLNELGSVKEFEIKIFLATWCSDSRKQVPRFYKILDIINIPTKIYALDEFKSCPNIDASQYKIELVPTFIFYSDSKEIGRIIESPKQSLEEDFLKIINTEDF